ncbi:GNAT family N-acetyltransferase [Arthrobacter sp. zg-Y179]|uniref:GNAT family N-acetyltransferase n=1 Tax=Arthrobacter sp. zg-Y179 TaxID=2894188 RepID=UPI001E2BC3E1|nr:N-acetyltransferase [Arthrobacter sp. zg-Y179]MCC9175337.1 N-acetyltransferase [Arthrobacter sp. zg-Y179]
MPHDLGTLTTTDLQELAASAAEDLAGNQNGETKERYLAVLSALEERHDANRGRERALRTHTVTPENTTVYNNRLHGRYELFVNGTLAAYLGYEMHRGELWALRITVDPDYRSKKIQTLLIEEVLADSLRRRVAVLPFCPETREHLAAKREYHKLVPREHWPRFTLRSPRKSRRRRAASAATASKPAGKQTGSQ